MTDITDTIAIYNKTFRVLDTLIFGLADGRDTTLYYDSTIVILDTLDAPTDTVIYNRTIELDKKYTLNYFILDMVRDTLTPFLKLQMRKLKEGNILKIELRYIGYGMVL